MARSRKGIVAALLSVVCLAASCITAQGTALQAVNPQWSEEKQQVKAPAWDMTEADIAAALAEKTVPAPYDYLYVGHGEDSLYGADWNLSEQVGAWRYGTGTAQFQLVDPASGAVYTTYCADIDTTSKVGWWYKVENLEDAAYYKVNGAADHIRGIALNGYWGTAAGTGSLDAMQGMLYNAVDSGALTAMTREDVAQLTEGEALTATQIAVWKYGNPYEVITLGANTLDVGSPRWEYCDSVLKSRYGMSAEDIDAALGRIDAVAQYLMSLSVTKAEAGETTVLGDDALVETMELTVDSPAGSDEGGAKRYCVSVVFSLKAPLQAGDDVTVQVLSPDGAVLAEGRIAPAETEGVLVPDSAGNYTLTGLTLAEGTHAACRLTLQGKQQLNRGVYVYTSEVRDAVSSQTFVGLAEGAVQVNASQTLDLTVTAPPEDDEKPDDTPEDKEPDDTPEDDEKPDDTPEGGGPPTYIPDPEPLVTSPKTGDGITSWASALVLSLSALPMTLRRKK